MVAVALWVGGYVAPVPGYGMPGPFPDTMLATWAAIGLVELVLASLPGAWVHREAGAAARPDGAPMMQPGAVVRLQDVLDGARSRVVALTVLATLLPLAPACGQEIDFEAARHRMVREEIARSSGSGPAVEDELVLRAMRTVPRHEFVPGPLRPLAYADRPLPIGRGQTISQPYIVARMTELLGLRPGEKVLEVGTGSGYQAAVLAEITDSVFSIEIIGELARSARERLRRLGYGQVTVRHGDGYGGWPEHAPFDAIIVTAAPEAVPPPLVEQLAPGGRMVLPRGPEGGVQTLLLVEKGPDGEVVERTISAVRFVPMRRDTAGGEPPPER